MGQKSEENKFTVSILGEIKLKSYSSTGLPITMISDTADFEVVGSSDGTISITPITTQIRKTKKAGSTIITTGVPQDNRNFFGDLAAKAEDASIECAVTSVLTSLDWDGLVENTDAENNGLGLASDDNDDSWQHNLEENDEDDGYCLIKGKFTFKMMTQSEYNTWHTSAHKPAN